MTSTTCRNTIDPHFVYLNWRKDNTNPRINFIQDTKDTVTIKSTVGPYKNVFSDQVF